MSVVGERIDALLLTVLKRVDLYLRFDTFVVI